MATTTAFGDLATASVHSSAHVGSTMIVTGSRVAALRGRAVSGALRFPAWFQGYRRHRVAAVDPRAAGDEAAVDVAAVDTGAAVTGVAGAEITSW